ncbi:hypothetical protein ACHAXR_008940, partial [Thalassiosira sp. AJA248-18]
GLATNLHIESFKQFVGSLRATGYPGQIILGIGPDAPQNVLQYLNQNNVTVKVVEMADNCTHNLGKILHTESWQCPKAYPRFKITWARFPLYKDWLEECPKCTDGVLLTDVRDSYFQRDSFATAVERKQQHPLMFFEEIFPQLDNTHWLTDFPVKTCKNYTVGKTPVLCSGSIMGSRNGIIDYIDAMVKEFDLWMHHEKCQINIQGDDQSIHNYLYYGTNKLKNARAIPHQIGPIHVVGWQAARIWEEAQIKSVEQNKKDATNLYVKNDKY